MADPDLQIKGMGLVAQKILSALQVSVWSKYKEGRAGRPHKPLPWILHWNRFSLVNEISFQNFRRMIPPSSFFTEGREKAHTRQRPKRSQPIPVSLAWSMHRSIATPPPPGREVSPSQGYPPPPPKQYVAGSIYTPGWRELFDGRGLDSGPPDPELESHTHAHWCECISCFS